MKKKKGLIFLICSCLFSCGPINNPDPSVFENLTMKDAYYDAYIYPNNPNASREETVYYKFLLKKSYKGNSIFFVAWNKYEENTNWKLSISNVEFLFSCEIDLLVFHFDSKTFLSVEESVNGELLSFEELRSCFKKLPEYISVTYYNKLI